MLYFFWLDSTQIGMAQASGTTYLILRGFFLKYAILLRSLYAKEFKLFLVSRGQPESNLVRFPLAPSVALVCSACSLQERTHTRARAHI